MQPVDFKIGAKVVCKEGECGKLSKLVVDPHTNRITDLVLEKGVLLKEDRVLPMGVVKSATSEEIQLTLKSDHLDKYPQYREKEYVVPRNEERVADAYGPMARYVTARDNRYGLEFPRPVVPRVKETRVTVGEGVSSRKAVIGRGTPVTNVDGTVGEVDHLLLDEESGRISHVVVNRGAAGHPLVVPIKSVERLSDDAIFISPDSEALGQVSCYMPRDSQDIQAELNDRLDEANCQLIGEPSIVENVVRLQGVVADVETKRRAEVVARSIEGVLDVENYLDTDTAIMSRVIVALHQDSRTETAVIDVQSHRGVVTLSGRVDSVEVRSAAVQIAQRQPGVIMVINELEVKPDEESGRLRFRESFYDAWPLIGPRTKT
jgi:uncharacterized protein YrrD